MTNSDRIEGELSAKHKMKRTLLDLIEQEVAAIVEKYEKEDDAEKRKLLHAQMLKIKDMKAKFLEKIK